MNIIQINHKLYGMMFSHAAPWPFYPIYQSFPIELPADLGLVDAFSNCAVRSSRRLECQTTEQNLLCLCIFAIHC